MTVFPAHPILDPVDDAAQELEISGNEGQGVGRIVLGGLVGVDEFNRCKGQGLGSVASTGNQESHQRDQAQKFHDLHL